VRAVVRSPSFTTLTVVSCDAVYSSWRDTDTCSADTTSVCSLSVATHLQLAHIEARQSLGRRRRSPPTTV
jgi:hypothetical protein